MFKKLTFEGIDNQGRLQMEVHFTDGETTGYHIKAENWARSIPYTLVKALADFHKISSPRPTTTQSSIWHVLGMMPTTDKSKVLAAYRRMAMVYHPDHGGDSKAFQTLSDARDKALAKCK